MTRKLKVFTGATHILGKQRRVCIATTSQKRAAEICGVSVGYVASHWSETGNAAQIEAATAHPETMMVGDIQYPQTADQWKPYTTQHPEGGDER